MKATTMKQTELNPRRAALTSSFINRRPPKKRVRGYSLIMTVMLLAMLGASVAVLVNVLVSSTSTTNEMVQRRTNFYACDGLGRVTTKLAQDYLGGTDTPTDADLQNFICTAGGGACPGLPMLSPAGFNVTQFTVTIGDSLTAPIPSGPFQDMNARQTTVRLDLRAERTGTGFACETHQDVTLAQIGLFQFFVFAEGHLDLFNPATMDVKGRIHVNGNFCASDGFGDLVKLETITTSGNIFVGGGCPKYMWTTGGGISVNRKGTAAYVTMQSSNDSTCTVCAPQSWQDYSLATWGGNIQDQAHGVPNLKLPVAGSPQVQDGRNASGAVEDNFDSQRLLIDPVLPGDTADIKEQRFAYKADIRIINGVWYKKDTGNPSNWPGIPIWSDHPGDYTTVASREENLTSGIKVGQDEIKNDLLYPSVPKRYSYYEYDTVNKRVFDDNSGVISYGTLARVNATSWVPGFYIHDVDDNAIRTADDPNDTPLSETDGEFKYRYCGFEADGSRYDSGSDFLMVRADTQVCHACVKNSPADVGDCGVLGVPLGVGANYLESTRFGFTDARVQGENGTAANATNIARSKILPVNFDVDQFTLAMQDLTAGELGSHFNGGADFNGIVYIDYTWQGQLGNFGGAGAGALASLWPNPNLITSTADDDPTQPLHMSKHAPGTSHLEDANGTRNLPWALCSGSLGYVPGTTREAFSGPAEDANDPGFDPLFTIPNCDVAVSPTSRPSAVRVHNAEEINKVTFPKGLTIATNMPAYILGDANKHSGDTPTDWVPMLVAADATSFLSNNWRDQNSVWEEVADLDDRIPTATSWRMAILSGDVSTSSTQFSGGFNNFPRFMEKWGGIATNIDGSMVIAFRSVYARDAWALDEIYTPPTRNWQFDPNLSTISNQPPGTPIYNVQAIKKWSAE